LLKKKRIDVRYMDILSSYKILTITHKSTHLKNIGEFVLSDVDTDAALQQKIRQIKHHLGLDELMYLATCNRVLFFFVTPQKLPQNFIANFQQVVYPEIKVDLSQESFFFEGKNAIQHLLNVSSSIDSLVVGEREILRQLRQAYSRCYNISTTGDSIRIAMQLAVETAKKVYSSTRIGEKPVSVVSLAIRQLLAKRPSKDARILIVGAGQTNTLVGKFLLKYGFSNFAIFNRTLANAQQLANMVDGEAYSLDQLANYQGGFDIMVVCTGATQAIVTPQLYQSILQDDQKKILIDLAVPNNIDTAVVEQFATDYIEIYGLKELVNENLAFRESEVTKATKIINKKAAKFESIYKGRQVELAMREVPNQIKAIKQHAIGNVFKNEVSSLDDNAKDLIARMMEYMERRCIAIPIQVAKENLAGVSSSKK